MMTCDHGYGRLMARAAGDPAFDDASLHAHLASCEVCRTAYREQQEVAGLLRERPAAGVSAGFTARVRGRIDDESSGGMLHLANWRAWGGTLAPLAAVLTLAAWLGVGLDAPNGTVGEAESLASWTRAAGDPEASVFLEPGSTRELLLETILTGAVPDGTGDPDVR